MLKEIDIYVGLKIISSELSQTQQWLAARLILSVSRVNAAIKQLFDSGLLIERQAKPYPVISAWEEYLISGFKYSFPIEPGNLTVGVPTAYAAEPLSKHIQSGSDPIPVWPFADGGKRGVAIQPIHKSVPQALIDFPDPYLHDFLVLLDALRIGRARERNLAKKLIREKLEETRVMKEKHL